MSSCINKKTVHEQGVKWAEWVFSRCLSARADWLRMVRRRGDGPTTPRTGRASGAPLSPPWGLGREVASLPWPLVEVSKGTFWKIKSSKHFTACLWNPCFSSKTFWNYETSHQVTIKGHFNFISNKNKCKFFLPNSVYLIFCFEILLKIKNEVLKYKPHLITF